MLLVEEEVEHNWVFSADQLEFDAHGINIISCLFLFLFYLVSYPYVILITLLLSVDLQRAMN